MPGEYRIYRHATRDAAQSDATLVATVPAGSLQHDLTGLASGLVAWYSVRAVSAGGVEQAEPARRVRVAIDDAGNLIAATPNPPIAPTLIRRSGGAMRVAWSYLPHGQAAVPATFYVYVGVNGLVDLTTPAASVAYRAGARRFVAELGPYSHGDRIRVVVRAAAAGGAEETNVAEAAAMALATAPLAPESIAAEVDPA